MNNKKEITLRDFIDLLHITNGFKKSHASLHLYTTNNDSICKTKANSIGVNPYLDTRVVSFNSNYDIVSGSYYTIILDISLPNDEGQDNDN